MGEQSKNPGEHCRGIGVSGNRGVSSFSGIARGSLAELETLVILCASLNFFPKETVANVLSGCDETGKLLTGLVKSPRRRPLHYPLSAISQSLSAVSTTTTPKRVPSTRAAWTRSASGCGTRTTRAAAFYPRQVFFPMAGGNERRAKLGRNLGAEIDENLTEAYNVTRRCRWRPENTSASRATSWTIRGIESLKVAKIDTKNSNLIVPPKRLEACCREHGIQRLAIFGSALRGDLGADSDVDVLAAFGPDRIRSLPGMARIRRDLPPLFDVQKVDLRTSQALSRYFRQDVIQQARVQYAKERRSSLETHA